MQVSPKSSAADAALMVQEEIDGCLVGRTTVNVEEFVVVARFYEIPAI
jgi:triosephosphate isomerase